MQISSPDNYTSFEFGLLKQIIKYTNLDKVIT